MRSLGARIIERSPPRAGGLGSRFFPSAHRDRLACRIWHSSYGKGLGRSGSARVHPPGTQDFLRVYVISMTLVLASPIDRSWISKIILSGSARRHTYLTHLSCSPLMGSSIKP
jgi:hypothetical protein